MNSFQDAVKSAVGISQELGRSAHLTVEQATEVIGKTVAPISENSFVQTLAKIPGLNWLLIGIGQVDIAKAEADVTRLKSQFPMEERWAIAQRVINETSMEAAKVGFLTNIIPPIALALFAVDLAAVTKLQAEMVYRIAAVYGFDLRDSVRRGEVIAIYGLSLGTGTPIKAGLSFVELIPVVGVAVGASSNAALIQVLGGVARQFYETKIEMAAASNSV
ncbi:MAG: hypothetical protein VKL39_05755 [Leptolyngbyaceae bacterium]|nr:hypothetical protein [Leptolyngbyaceae bacterium]